MCVDKSKKAIHSIKKGVYGMSNEENKHGFLNSLLEHKILIVWQPRYNLGIPIIDEQHRGIVSVINSLHFGIENDQGENFLKPIVGMVYEYTRIHFEAEERFLEICGYPYVEDHHKMHEELRFKLQTIGDKSLKEQTPGEFLEFLKDWFVDHICEKDRQFRDFLLEMIRF